MNGAKSISMVILATLQQITSGNGAFSSMRQRDSTQGGSGRRGKLYCWRFLLCLTTRYTYTVDIRIQCYTVDGGRGEGLARAVCWEGAETNETPKIRGLTNIDGEPLFRPRTWFIHIFTQNRPEKGRFFFVFFEFIGLHCKTIVKTLLTL